MKRLFTNDAGRTGWFDHLLAAIAGCLVLYSVGQATGQPPVGDVLICVFLVGKLISWLVGSLAAGSKFVRADGILYVLAVAVLGFVFGGLNSQFGENNPFQGVFTSLGFLAWMIVFGSFWTWRDGTILFQAVPSIAIFGLVGCYDTFRPVTYYFFGFLLCIATLFARINARNMLDYAVRSGAPISRESGDGTALQALRRGPWRSVAGPTWALLSAAIIVLLSFLGAPIVQDSVQSVVGHLRLPVPASIYRPAAQTYFQTALGSALIGRGPVTLNSEPVARVAMDQPRYLRASIYHSYTGSGWDKFDTATVEKEEVIGRMLVPAREEIRDPRQIHFSIEMVTNRGGILPVPGEVTELAAGNGDAYSAYDGTFQLRPAASLAAPFEGTALVAPDGEPRTAQKDMSQEALDIYTSTANIPSDVADLARQCTARSDTDYDKAMAIKAEIDRRLTYDINAPAVPDGKDPVSFALFQSKRGYCDLFASSMVLMARTVGIPSRYVTGFYPFDDARDSAGRFTIHQKDAHAWAELFFRDYGWVAFDATDGAAEAEGSARGSETTAASWYNTTWFAWTVRTASGLASGFMPFAFLQWRERRADRNPARERIARIYSRFNRALEKKSGRARQPHETPEEYLASVTPSLNGTAAAATSLTSEFLGALYGPHSLGEDEYAKLQMRVREFERSPKNKE